MLALALASLLPSLACAQQASAPPLVLEPMRVTPLVQVVVTTPIEIQSSASDAPPLASEALGNPGSTAPEPASTVRETPSHEPARCSDGQAAYFDARSQIYRPCPAPMIARSEPRGARAGSPRDAHRCPPGARSYFDERNQLYRPCPERAEPDGDRASAGRSPAASRAPSSSSRPRCAPGARAYYDEAHQLYRPCP